MSDFELIILGFFIGCIFTFVIAGTGVWFDYTRTNRRIHKGDNDMRIYIPSRNRDRCGNDRCDKQVESETERKRKEEADKTESCVAVLQTMIHSTRYCQREHEALAFAIDFMEKYGDYE